MIQILLRFIFDQIQIFIVNPNKFIRIIRLFVNVKSTFLAFEQKQKIKKKKFPDKNVFYSFSKNLIKDLNQ
jgi:hypothetical protein